MHIFDPTVDWPSELVGKEIPDLLYLKSNDPLNLSLKLDVRGVTPHSSSFQSWTEYRSLDNAQSIAILLINSEYVGKDREIEAEIDTLLRNLSTQHVEICRYRKIQTTSKSQSGPVGMSKSYEYTPTTDQNSTEGVHLVLGI